MMQEAVCDKHVYLSRFWQTIEDTNGTNILDQSVIKKGTYTHTQAHTHLPIYPFTDC